jgi:hypothetical protein
MMAPVSRGGPSGVLPGEVTIDMADEMFVEDGFLVLADISGFTAFVTTTEVEHGAWATGTLLETVMGRLAPPLEIQELEGDAVFALGPDRIIPDGAALPALFVGALSAFKDQQQRMVLDPGCDCRACQGLADLDLKLIAHYGRFVRQLVGGRSRVTGPDVILAHRLLKNGIGAGAYVLLTEPALTQARVDPSDPAMRRHLLSYSHFGEVACFVVDGDALRREVHPAMAVGTG